jgi:hypothetical protein
MKHHKQNIGIIHQGNDATSINNKRGMARKAKRSASKIRRSGIRKQMLKDGVPLDFSKPLVVCEEATEMTQAAWDGLVERLGQRR